MNTNAIGGAPTQQAPLEKTEAVGSSKGPGNERIHNREEIFRPASVPPLIRQNEIAKHFIRLDSAADPGGQGPAQQTGPHSQGGSGPPFQFEGTARSENLRAIVNENPDFFKQLFTSVQNGDLNNRPNLITDGLLIDFVLSLPEDPE